MRFIYLLTINPKQLIPLYGILSHRSKVIANLRIKLANIKSLKVGLHQSEVEYSVAPQATLERLTEN